MKRLLFALFLAGCAHTVTAPPPLVKAPHAPIYGHDILGLGNSNVKADTVIQGIEPGIALGFFSNDWPGSFGNPYPKLEKIGASGKPSLFRGQCYWSYQHKPAPLSNVRSCATKLESLALKFPNIRVFGSPSCEYDSSTTKKQVQDWIKAFQSRAPHVSIVLTPMNGPVIPGFLIERHGDKVVGAKALSTDGQSIYDANAAKLLADNPDAEYQLGWGLRYNLAESGTKVAPPNRTAAPSVPYIRSIGALNKPRIIGNFKYPQLYKTHAEDQVGEGDRRANRPLLILKEKVTSVQILDSQNHVLGKFPYYGSYLDQGFRYYSGSPGGMGLYGYEIGDLARKNTGSDAIKVKAGTHVYDIGSAAFRGNYYQK